MIKNILCAIVLIWLPLASAMEAQPTALIRTNISRQELNQLSEIELDIARLSGQKEQNRKRCWLNIGALIVPVALGAATIACGQYEDCAAHYYNLLEASTGSTMGMWTMLQIIGLINGRINDKKLSREMAESHERKAELYSHIPAELSCYRMLETHTYILNGDSA